VGTPNYTPAVLGVALESASAIFVARINAMRARLGGLILAEAVPMAVLESAFAVGGSAAGSRAGATAADVAGLYSPPLTGCGVYGAAPAADKARDAFHKRVVRARAQVIDVQAVARVARG
jgi:hypothetical protein